MRFINLAIGICLLSMSVGCTENPTSPTKNQTNVIAPTAMPIVMIRIPSGSFSMGSNTDNGNSDARIRNVSLSSYCISQTEITWNQWTNVRAWAVAHGYDLSNKGNEGENPSGTRFQHPVTTASWYSVVKWCNALSEMQSQSPCYFIDDQKTTVYRSGEYTLTGDMVAWTNSGYRLPTEAEWEYACRAGSTSSYYWGSWNGLADDTGINPNAWYSYNGGTSGGSFYTHEVAQKSSNAFGLYDMSGNVLEWCWDLYGNYPTTNQTNPTGDVSGLYRTVRGGGLNSSAGKLRSGYRDNDTPTRTSIWYGFRICKS